MKHNKSLILQLIIVIYDLYKFTIVHSFIPSRAFHKTHTNSIPKNHKQIVSSQQNNRQDIIMTKHDTNNNHSSSSCEVTYGPDLNESKSPMDKKLYRQLILNPNGLRVVLISDVLAMGQDRSNYDYDDDEDDYEDDDDEEEDDNQEEDDEENDDDDEEEEDGLRKAAAAIVVGAGSFHDPPFAQGMAHFLEHMLFMGTEKYPLENEYDAFLSKNGGSDNAYTELEHTMYHLEVAQDKFFEALDMLAQFFISPLMVNDAVTRELNAIESEFQLSKNSDECRLQQLLCHISSFSGCSVTTNSSENRGNNNNRDDEEEQEASISTSSSNIHHRKRHHPFSNFSWGNIHSLKTIPQENGIDIMHELRRFYNNYYYAQNMSLVVIGAYSLDELESQVIKCFSAVPALPRSTSTITTSPSNNNNHHSSEHDHCMYDFYDSLAIRRTNAGTFNVQTETPIQKFGMPFNANTLGRICRIVPVKDRHNLTITWQVPPQWSNWKSKPCDYISHLLGHEGSGSLLSALKAKSWVTGCYAGVGSGGYENASSHALFTLNFTLSTEGVTYWKDIVTYVYNYIGMIRYYSHYSDGLPSWIFEELRAIQDVMFQFQEEHSPVDLAENIAERLAPYVMLPPERLLDGDDLLFEFDGEVVKDILDNYFKPSNARIDLMSSSFGRASDFDGHTTESKTQNSINDSRVDDGTPFSVELAGEPNIEPYFGSQFWSHKIADNVMEVWSKAVEPQLPPPNTMISLPPVNPFVPKRFDLKATAPDDSHHPLLNCCLKICVTVGKKKSWFPCTVTKYDATQNKVLLHYEDEEEKWHIVDNNVNILKEVTTNTLRDYEGTFDNKAIKFKVVAVPRDGEGAVLKYGDESDHNVEDGIHFPPIPPALPKSRLPQLVENTQLLKIWHLQDRKFKRPHAELRMNFIAQDANKSPLYRGCADLLTHLCHDALTEICYLASVCELGNSISATDVGFGIRVYGFDDKLLELTEQILNVFLSFTSSTDKLPDTILPGRFEACLEVLMRKYGNAGMSASSLCSDVRLRCIRPTIWSPNQKASALKDISIPVFVNTINTMLSKVSIESLYHGNVDSQDAIALKDLVTRSVSDKSIGIQKNVYPKQHVLVTPSKKEHHIVIPTVDAKEANTAVEVYFQVGKDNLGDRVLIDLLTEMMYEPLFNQLRTKEQFGYQVSCGSRWTYGVTGICFKVVTNCKSPNEVYDRVQKFLDSFRNDLVNMSDESFMEHVVGLAKNKLQKFNSLQEESNSIWSEITEHRYDWEVNRNEALALRSSTREQTLKAFDDWLYPDTRKCGVVIVQAIGNGDAPIFAGRPVVENIGEFIDDQVQSYHKLVGKTTWGNIY